MTRRDSDSESRLSGLLAEIDEQIADGSPSGAAHAVEDDESKADSRDFGELSTEEAEALSRGRQILDLIDRVRAVPEVSDERFDSGRPTPSPGSETVVDVPQQIGRFEIVRELGRGGYGIVYLARDVELEREVALKLPGPQTLFSTNARERFLREGKTVAALQHSNIVPLYDVGQVGMVGYMVSAYCRGPSLAEWLRSNDEPVDFSTAARLVRDLASAVGYAHERGVVHRDLKPGNVLLEQVRDPRRPGDSAAETDEVTLVPMVTDFGLAKVLEADDDQTQSGSKLGTPAYMSPEQAAGETRNIGPATDIYALGVILYELLTRRRPTERSTTLATLRAVQVDDISSPSALRHDVPARLEAVCLKCLEKNPADRFATAHQLADELNEYLADRDVAPRDPTGRRLKWGLVSLGIAAAVLAVCFSLGFFSAENGDPTDGTSRSRSTADAASSAIPSNTDNPARDKQKPSLGDSLDLQVARWVLGQSGRNQVFGAGPHGSGYFSQLDELPEAPFVLSYVSFDHAGPLDDRQLGQLDHLANLKTVRFAATPLTGEQFARLKLPRCTTLTLYLTDVSEDGLTHLADLRELRSLELRDRDYSDACLKHVVDCPDLEELSLLFTNVTDDGLRQLTTMKNLRSLSLRSSSQVSDSLVESLLDMTWLTKLDVRDTQVTDAGGFRLKAALPNCNVLWSAQ